MARTQLEPVVPTPSPRDSFRHSLAVLAIVLFGTLGVAASPLLASASPWVVIALGLVPAAAAARAAHARCAALALERVRAAECARRGGKPVLGKPPERDCFAKALADARGRGKTMLDRYLVGFEVDTGKPLWVSDDDICTHAAVFAKTGVGKTLWLESLMFQQMARGRASGCTFIDAKRDSGTLAQVILMAVITGRIEDLIVIDPFDPVHAYNFVATGQQADVKARKVLRAGLPPASEQSVVKHYDRLATDAIYRLVRAFERVGLSWLVRDVAAALSAFPLSYPHLSRMLHKIGAADAVVELGHLAASYRTPRGTLDAARLADNFRGIASELHAIAGSRAGETLCPRHTDLVLTDAILRGKVVYYMLPRLEEAETAARLTKVFREDLEVSIGEITSSRTHRLEDPHLVIIDEGSSTFGPTWANLFELARKGRFALLFGAQSAGGLTDASRGLSDAFYERVMANVNLKVMMRVGDNRTASDAAEWFGKVPTTRRVVGAGVSSAVSRAGMVLDRRWSDGSNRFESFSEGEEDRVSADELKHELSAEKGLAWFDLGDGRVVKGRAFWVDAAVPDSWDARRHLVRHERTDAEPLGLADWVGRQILRRETAEHAERPPREPAERPPEPPKPPEEEAPPPPLAPKQPGVFKLGATPRRAGRVFRLAKPPSR